ncbi:hypothetical protein HNQ80_000320 [Anaerosolibacter carboniphilus]|uniref:DUF2269 family protein n=1 Tax=Anaerosolibacter carboniphilus TaxID=1417629 RepID=A0A841KLX7_9FIRM|nr:DUF2269 domain-containing protein [Anaerosolibacter carboniphilus]MBB6214251.1 hypothetical protein [Anaerosolibacter carboniphilus]
MKKLGSQGLKWLKIVHILLIILFLGGIISTLAINSHLKISTFDEAYATYKSSIIISDYVVKYGAQGTLIIGIVYGVFTNWGFLKHRWIAVKWLFWIAQTFIGIFVVDRLMVANMAILEAEKVKALSNPVFLQNHTTRQYVVIVQIVLSTFLICISILKPWRKKSVTP